MSAHVLLSQAPNSSPDFASAYYGNLARGFTGVLDSNLAFWGSDMMDRASWVGGVSGAGSVSPDSSNVAGPGILRCVGPNPGATGASLFNSKGGGLVHASNLRTKRWFLVGRFANTSSAGAIASTRINVAVYNGRNVGFGICGNTSTTKFAFMSSPDFSHYDGVAASTVTMPALGTFVWGWIGNNGINIMGSFADPVTGLHEPPVQVDLASNLASTGGVFQCGVFPNNSLAAAVNQEQADYDAYYFWCER